jgi:hypothetical protein
VCLIGDARDETERPLRADHQSLEYLDRVSGREVGEGVDRVARRVLDRVLLVDKLHQRRVGLVRARARARARARLRIRVGVGVRVRVRARV